MSAVETASPTISEIFAQFLDAQRERLAPRTFANYREVIELFADCLNGNGPKAYVARAEREARRLGLRATPSIFVNGRPLRSRHLERDLERLIDGSDDSGRS